MRSKKICRGRVRDCAMQGKLPRLLGNTATADEKYDEMYYSPIQMREFKAQSRLFAESSGQSRRVIKKSGKPIGPVDLSHTAMS